MTIIADLFASDAPAEVLEDVLMNWHDDDVVVNTALQLIALGVPVDVVRAIVLRSSRDELLGRIGVLNHIMALAAEGVDRHLLFQAYGLTEDEFEAVLQDEFTRPNPVFNHTNTGGTNAQTR